MSAMPAQNTERSFGTEPRRMPAAQHTLRRTERRAQLHQERRVRRQWALLSCGLLAACFGLTVGVLGVLH